MTPHVAMIGVGRMGAPMADRVVAAGFDVTVFDLDPTAVSARVEHGARAATSPAEAAREARVVGIVVFDDAQVLDVVAGPDGVLRTLASGAVICVHTTASIATLHDLARRCEPHGVAVIDAGISGGESGAATGTLLTMAGGSDDAFALARPVFDSFSKRVIHAGPLGTGMALKLARNAVAYAVMAVVHESLVLADACGVELAMLNEALTTTSVFEQGLVPLGFGSPGPLPAGGDAELRAILEHAVSLAEKDLDQTRALAADHALDLPIFAATRDSFRAVMRL